MMAHEMRLKFGGGSRHWAAVVSQFQVLIVAIWWSLRGWVAVKPVGTLGRTCHVDFQV